MIGALSCAPKLYSVQCTMHWTNTLINRCRLHNPFHLLLRSRWQVLVYQTRQLCFIFDCTAEINNPQIFWSMRKIQAKKNTHKKTDTTHPFIGVDTMDCGYVNQIKYCWWQCWKSETKPATKNSININKERNKRKATFRRWHSSEPFNIWLSVTMKKRFISSSIRSRAIKEYKYICNVHDTRNIYSVCVCSSSLTRFWESPWVLCHSFS